MSSPPRTSDTTSLFFNSLNNTPLTVADSLRSLSSMLTTFQTQLTDMGVQVSAVQTQLASDNRNDIASALQNLVNSLASANASILTNTANIASHETRLQRFKSKRVTTFPPPAAPLCHGCNPLPQERSSPGT